MLSRLATMFQRSGSWTIDSLRLVRAVLHAPPSQRRQTLLNQANLKNQAAMSFLRADKELSLVRYYGLPRYLQEKQVFHAVPSFLPNASAAKTETTPETSPRLGETDKPAAAKVPFMITTEMRKDLEDLEYSPESLRRMTPVEANIVLKHKLPPERYESEIASLVQQEKELMKIEVVQDEPTPSPSADSRDGEDELGNQANDEESVDIQTETEGRVWYEVVEQSQGKEPSVVGLFMQESEALSCQKVYEELARKKQSKSTFITKETRKM